MTTAFDRCSSKQPNRQLEQFWIDIIHNDPKPVEIHPSLTKKVKYGHLTNKADPSPNDDQQMVPTAVLQPPLFGRSFPRAYNYGTIGYMVAREMLHGFYNRGLNFDEEGNYVNWLSNETVTDLNTRTSCLAERLGRGGTGDWNRTLYEKVAASEGLRLALKVRV
ncbi:hypothetical protein NECAME_13667 [Necator americanus]|uniref:Peptidase M13 C-terminal domain-containing protein n=1 Tax=Necator americanus TaxID=51031 RepID=W2STY5_NECAM|nr:hypothetical protein NECAME_13667 [Necator americanus]ETN72973.1 hypothetical protein NECAME_13667 [Necator americanus]